MLNDDYQLIEGLVVDGVNGGIGFRNHTIPVGFDLGAQWSEDLLWLQPETACTSTNLTLHFSITEHNFYEDNNGYLRDDGGFAAISPFPPEPRWDQDGWRDVGPTPDLKRRADVAAWWNNQLVAQTMNITKTQLGSVFGGLSGWAELLSNPTSLKIEPINGGFLNQAIFDVNSTSWLTFNAYGKPHLPQTA